ncbi:T9SS type A sorting domain-containing protein [Flavobacterium sp. SUN046]|uniref:T9SS type A sorting domain-containing protein n=1 Tax=Flavobacterium sp. SUN046 TaxID=3002440 RepID=UPI002DBB4B86|nr:T9SS type A sorting domain-containing protein [Flavobacterium sp. SUN046]MEC4049989.1 T9SS type A sorting domain-containing protein [Flavobacterium sp. SUN046]
MKQILLILAFGISGLLNAQLQVNSVAVTTNDLVYDSNTDRIYVTIPSSNGSNGNSIGVINPNTFTLDQTIFMGSEPTEMAISDNGEYIYTAFSGSATVRRFNVATKTAEIQFPLGSDSFSGSYYAYDLSVMPGNSHALAVSRNVQSSTGFYGVAIYDDGVPRATTTISTYPNNYSYVINFNSSSLMYGFNNHSTGFNLNRLAVNAGGVNEISTTGSIVYNFNINNFVTNNNNLYFDFGAIVDVSGSPFNIGQFTGADGRVMYDAYNNLVCFATYDFSGNIIFKRYNPNTYLIYDSKVISNAFGSVKHIVSCGNGCYAFNTSDNKVIIIRNGNLAVNEQITESAMTVYPNPATDYLNVKSDLKIKDVKIFDFNGRFINQIEFNNEKVYIGNLEPGIYITKISDEDGNLTVRKIIKE